MLDVCVPEELGIVVLIAHTILRKKHLCSYLLNVFLVRYYLLNVRNSEFIHKILLFQDFRYYRFKQQRLLNNVLKDYNCHHYRLFHIQKIVLPLWRQCCHIKLQKELQRWSNNECSFFNTIKL